jgi:isoquinoline 1-oxidoreductase beta subunit
MISRRAFLFGASAAAGGLVLVSKTVSAQLPKGGEPAAPEVTAWIVIQPDDITIIRVARSDMGQGIFTALPMLVAEELECDWSKVRAEYAEPAANLARGKVWGDMVTSTSISVRASQEYLRRAGAQAREMLIAEAASRWQVTTKECVARNSAVIHLASGRSLRFGEIAAAASRRPVPENIPLKTPDQWSLLGTNVRRHDARPKVFGEPIYATDINLPGMLHAAVAACPSYGGKLTSFDAANVLRMPGVIHVVPVSDNAVAVVAQSWWQAKQGLDALPVVWDEAPSAGLSTSAMREIFRQGLDASDAATGHSIGDVEASLAGAAKLIEVEYEVPHLAHATMEPQTCTAYVTSDRAEVWAPTQNGEGTTNVVATTLGLNPSQVFVHKLHLGGGFGRRGLAQDWARMSVLIARQIPQPVKMIWSREEDMTHDYYRPMVMARQTAGFDASGNLLGWKVRLCGSSIAASLSPRWLRDGVDYALMDGFSKEDFPYAIPAYSVACTRRETAIPVGFWRGVNLSQNGFFREAFVDEMAKECGVDPYQFRRKLLAGNPRALGVLDEVAERANWGQSVEGRHQGIAIVEGDHSWCAQVIEISVSGGVLKIHRVICVVDPNFIVNPDIVTAQMEGGIVQGLSAALTGEITVERGRVQQRNFHNYPFLRINEMPTIEVHLLPSLGKYGGPWGGIGETGLPPSAPALINAIFAATGKRIRTLPIVHHDLKPNGG